MQNGGLWKWGLDTELQPPMTSAPPGSPCHDGNLMASNPSSSFWGGRLETKGLRPTGFQQLFWSSPLVIWVFGWGAGLMANRSWLRNGSNSHTEPGLSLLFRILKWSMILKSCTSTCVVLYSSVSSYPTDFLTVTGASCFCMCNSYDCHFVQLSGTQEGVTQKNHQLHATAMFRRSCRSHLQAAVESLACKTFFHTEV